MPSPSSRARKRGNSDSASSFELRRVLGEDHPSTLATGNELIMAVVNQRRWREAEAAFCEILEARRKVLGDDHPDTLTTRHNLAWMVTALGRWGKAEAAFRELLEVRQRVQGNDHPDTVTTRRWIDESVQQQRSTDQENPEAHLPAPAGGW